MLFKSSYSQGEMEPLTRDVIIGIEFNSLVHIAVVVVFLFF
jgi:hypothetical protein